MMLNSFSSTTLVDFSGEVVIYLISQFLGKGIHLIFWYLLRHLSFPNESMELLIANFEVEIDIAKVFEMLSRRRTHIRRQVARPEKIGWHYIVIKKPKLLQCFVDCNAAFFLIRLVQFIFLFDDTKRILAIVTFHLHWIGFDFWVLILIAISTFVAFVLVPVLLGFLNFCVKGFA